METINAYLMRKDELSLINFYTENKNKILAQSDINEMNNFNNINKEYYFNNFYFHYHEKKKRNINQYNDNIDNSSENSDEDSN